MELSQLTIYASWAAIVMVPIAIIGLFITFRSLKSKGSRIKKGDTKFSEIGDSINQKDITVEAKKYPDNTIEIKLTGPFDNTLIFQRSLPQCDERVFHVAMTWKNDKFELYLNGKPEDSKTVEEAE